MTRRKKTVIKFIAVMLSVAMIASSAVLAFADGTGNSVWSTKASKYDKPDINALTGHGEEPEDISVSANATYQEKAWYEYVTYSDKAVCSYRLDDESRLLFYDPYTYTNAMVSDVYFDQETTEFNTMSEYSVSYTKSKTIDACVSSTDTDTQAVQTSGVDHTTSNVTNTGTTKTTYNHSVDNPTYGTKSETTQKNYKEYRYTTSADTESSSVSGGAGTKNLLSTAKNVVSGALTGGIVGGLVGLASGIEVSADSSKQTSHTETNTAAIVLDNETKTTTYSDDYKTSTEYTGDDTVEYNTKSETEGWTELSARVTKTIGSSITTSSSWSESESTTVTKTYAATHFASDGVTPLPWAVVHYSVQMPLKCCLQIKISGEWVTISTVYCLLTTVQGTCRAWMQNGQAYCEDWGSGEPITIADFWSRFLTKEQLVNAYTNQNNAKLYPVGGED